MKLLEHFDNFLTNTVNINATRLDQLDDSVEAIKGMIRDSDWKAPRRGFTEQGSWAHRTIIKPVAGKAFDADLLVMVDPVDGWSANTEIS
jgi:hypothetical protein